MKRFLLSAAILVACLLPRTAQAVIINADEITAATTIQLDIAGTNIVTITASGMTLNTGTITYSDDAFIGFGTGSDIKMGLSTANDYAGAQLEDFVIALSDLNQSMHITDDAARATDWNLADISDPTVYIHSNSTPITDYMLIGGHDGTDAYIDVAGGTGLNLGIGGTYQVELTDGAFSPVTTNDVDLGLTGATFKVGWLEGTLDFNTGVINSTNVLTFQIGAVDILALDDSAITLAAETDVAGQDIYIQTEDAGATPTTAKTGGLLELRTGDGPAAATTVVAGAGGALNLVSGGGGAQTGTVATGAGGQVDITAGDAGDSSGAGASTSDGATGGLVDINAGVGGASAATDGGAHAGTGGAVEIAAGAGGIQNGSGGGNGGDGGALTFVSGAGADGVATDGDGGAVGITAGQAGGSASATGGTVTILAGAANSGTAGNINIGITNAATMTLGRVGGITQINGDTTILDSTDLMTFQIGTVDILGLDENGLTFAAATNVAGNDAYLQTEDAGGTATTAKTGGLLEVRTGDGSASTGNFAGGAAGAMTLVTGGGGANTGAATGQAGGAGGAVAITSGAGGATDDQGSDNGGAGGAMTLTTGAGAASTDGSGDGGAGGAFTVAIGDGAATVGGTAGVGGAIAATSGAGAAQGTNDTGGVGGALTLTSGDGGLNSMGASGVAGGAAGATNLLGGAGGTTNSTGNYNGGAGSTISVTGGVGGSQTSGANGSAVGGAGGASNVLAGAGGACSAGTGNGGTGGQSSLIAGVGGASAGGTHGTGGAILITSGASGGASGTAGAITIAVGSAASGTEAAINMGVSNALSTTIGRADRETNLNGQVRIDRRNLYEVYEEFNLDAGATEPLPWLENQHTAGTIDYMADESLGVLQLATTTADAAQAIQITWGDHLTIDIDNDPIIIFRVRVDNIAGLTTVEKVLIGVVPVHTNAEDAHDNIDDSCWFLLKGATGTDVYVESDDGGGNDTDDQDSNQNVVDDTWVIYKIDMSTLADIKMYVDDIEQTGATLNMAASTGAVLQPIVCFNRADNSQTEAIVQIEIDYIQVTQER